MTPPAIVGLAVILGVVIVLMTWVLARHLGGGRQARAQLAAGQDYRALAEEFRRLSDVSITAQEHVDLRLTDIGVQVGALRERVEQLQRILSEVE